MLAKKILGLALSLVTTTSHAATPSVLGTSWDLLGKFGGKIVASCQLGGTRDVPIAVRKNIKAKISFYDDATAGDNEGRFTWFNDDLHAGVVKGKWTQKGSKLELSFNHWYDSPLGINGYGLAKAFASGKIPTIKHANVEKLLITSDINSTATVLDVSEVLAFNVTASASYAGISNTCKYSIKLDRSYKGTRVKK